MRELDGAAYDAAVAAMDPIEHAERNDEPREIVAQRGES